MKLLLTSAGVRNPTLLEALTGMLDKPIAESDALCIPTSSWGHPYGSPQGAWRFVAGQGSTPMVELGWGSMGLLELTALPGIERERWEGWVREADVLLVNGGDACYLARWMRESGLADLLPSLEDKVWVGLSAGSMVMSPRVGSFFLEAPPPVPGDDSALGVVDFAIFPHLEHPMCPENTMEEAERWAAEIGIPCYALDDECAIRVVDGQVDVVSEGKWRFFDGS